MSLIQKTSDSLGYPLVVQLTTEGDDLTEAPVISLPYRAILAHWTALSETDRVKLAQRLFHQEGLLFNNLYFRPDIYDKVFRVAQQSRLFTDKGQAKLFTNELVQQIRKDYPL